MTDSDAYWLKDEESHKGVPFGNYSILFFKWPEIRNFKRKC